MLAEVIHVLYLHFTWIWYFMYLSSCTTLDIYFLYISGSTSNRASSLFSVGCAREPAGHRNEAIVAQGAAHMVCRFKYCTSSQIAQGAAHKVCRFKYCTSSQIINAYHCIPSILFTWCSPSVKPNMSTLIWNLMLWNIWWEVKLQCTNAFLLSKAFYCQMRVLSKAFIIKCILQYKMFYEKQIILFRTPSVLKYKMF
jgi:hypothetical protein